MDTKDLRTPESDMDRLHRYTNIVRGRGTDLDRIYDLTELISVAVALRIECVDQARKSGASWSAIGDQMGISKQAAQQSFGR